MSPASVGGYGAYHSEDKFILPKQSGPNRGRFSASVLCVELAQLFVGGRLDEPKPEMMHHVNVPPTSTARPDRKLALNIDTRPINQTKARAMYKTVLLTLITKSFMTLPCRK